MQLRDVDPNQAISLKTLCQAFRQVCFEVFSYEYLNSQTTPATSLRGLKERSKLPNISLVYEAECVNRLFSRIAVQPPQ